MWLYTAHMNRSSLGASDSFWKVESMRQVIRGAPGVGGWEGTHPQEADVAVRSRMWMAGRVRRRAAQPSQV